MQEAWANEAPSRPRNQTGGPRDPHTERRRCILANSALCLLYQEWYRLISAWLPGGSHRRAVEIGSGLGLSRRFIDCLWLTDVVPYPGLDVVCEAERLPFASGSLEGVILLDVFHHLARPAAFLVEAARVLSYGGRLIVLEPCVSVLSYPVYRWLHHEGMDVRVDILQPEGPGYTKRPEEGNQAIATIVFEKQRDRLRAIAPGLRLIHCQRLSGPSYPLAVAATWGLPILSVVRVCALLERGLPRWLGPLIAFRLIAVLERGSDEPVG